MAVPYKSKSQSNNPYLLTLPQLMSAKKKIGRIAAFHDPQKNLFNGFDAQALSPTQFREQLRRNFSINLDNSELGATIMLFDKDGDGGVDSTEFINEYLKLGQVERRKHVVAHKMRQDKLKREDEKRRKEREEKFLSLLKPVISDTWTKEEEESAIRKVARVAYTYDRVKDAKVIQTFNKSGPLNPGEFKALMRTNFEVHLSPAETGAIMNLFDEDKNGLIDCGEFIIQFFRLGRQERDRHLRLKQKITNRNAALEIERRAEIKRRYGKLATAKLRPANDEHTQSAVSKIQKAAAYYSPNIFMGPITRSFEADCLDPTAFKEALKQNFGIYLTPEELDATLKIFDVDNNGTISTAEFLSTFFRMGSEEKLAVLKKTRRRNEKIATEKKKFHEDRMRKALESVKTRVDWPVLPNVEGEEEEEINTPTKSVEETSIRRRECRKPSIADTLDTKPLKKTNVYNSSIADKFVKASDSTKDFIRELEETERKIWKGKKGGVKSG